MRERDRLVAECARVLRPGGRVVLCDLLRHREIPFREVRDRREDFAVLRAAFGDAHFETLAWYEQAAQDNGLVVDRLDDLTQATLPTFDRWRANARDHRAEVLELMSAEDLDAFERSTDLLEGFWQGDRVYLLDADADGRPLIRVFRLQRNEASASGH